MCGLFEILMFRGEEGGCVVNKATAAVTPLPRINTYKPGLLPTKILIN